jgi:hypothetical protein
MTNTKAMETQNNFTEVETQRLAELEVVITKNFLAFYEVGCALKEIRMMKLYRASHDTFELYCREMWDMAKRNVYQLIAASKVIDVLSANVEQTEKMRHGALSEIIPLNERQTRPLTRLETPEQQIEAWSKAVETAPNGRITAKHVNDVVSEIVCKEVKEKNEKIKEKMETTVSKEFYDAMAALIEVVRAEAAKPLTAKMRENMRDYIRHVGNLLAD